MGEEGTDNLQELEDSLAEEYAAEDGGTGLSYYNENGYDYDASSPLTDIDYQGPNESDAYTANNTGAEAYDPVRRDDDDEDAVRGGGMDDDDYDGSYPSYHKQRDDNNGDSRGRERDADEEYVDEDNKDNDESGDADNANPNRFSARQNATQRQQDDGYNGAIKWRPGQPITVELLDQVWGKCKKIKQVRPMCETLNKAVESVVLPPSDVDLTLRAFVLKQKNTNPDMDTIDALLKLTQSFFSKLKCLVAGVAEGFAIHNWRQLPKIVAFDRMAFQFVLGTAPVGPIAQQIFTVAVPLINQMDRDKKKQ